MDTVTDVKTCQHCGSQAPAARTYCPECRRKMTPVAAAAASGKAPEPDAGHPADGSADVIDLREGGAAGAALAGAPLPRRGLLRRLLGRR